MKEEYPKLDCHLEEEKVKSQSKTTGFKRRLKQTLILRQCVLSSIQSLRLFYTERKNSSKVEGEKYKSYIIEDRKKTLVSNKEGKLNKDDYPNKIPDNFLKPVSKHIDDFFTQPVWNYKIENKNYKGLKSRARQKLRAFNAKKKIKNGTSIVFMMDKAKQEKVVEKFLTKRDKKRKELEIVNKEEAICNLVIEDSDNIKNEGVDFLISGDEEKDSATLYKDLIFNQLNELRRENEELKKKILQIREEKELKASLQQQTDHLELEKTKLRPWRMVMTSIIEAFSNFCRKLAWKSDSKLLPAFVKDKEDDDFDGFENELDYGKNKPNENYNEKYYNFLENLMKDEVQCQGGKCTGK